MGTPGHRIVPEIVLLVRSRLASGMAALVMVDTRPHADGSELNTAFPDRLKLMGRAKADHALGRLPARRFMDRSRLFSVVMEAHWSLRVPLRAFRDRLTCARLEEQQMIQGSGILKNDNA